MLFDWCYVAGKRDNIRHVCLWTKILSPLMLEPFVTTTNSPSFQMMQGGQWVSSYSAWENLWCPYSCSNISRDCDAIATDPWPKWTDSNEATTGRSCGNVANLENHSNRRSYVNFASGGFGKYFCWPLFDQDLHAEMERSLASILDQIRAYEADLCIGDHLLVLYPNSIFSSIDCYHSEKIEKSNLFQCLNIPVPMPWPLLWSRHH